MILEVVNIIRRDGRRCCDYLAHTVKLNIGISGKFDTFWVLNLSLSCHPRALNLNYKAHNANEFMQNFGLAMKPTFVMTKVDPTEPRANY